MAILHTISKQEIVDFYEKYIAPASPQRAKLSIHLIAEKSTEKNKASNLLIPEQQKQMLVQSLYQFLSDAGIKTEAEILSRNFKDVDISTLESIAAAVGTYLKKDWKLDDEKLAAVMEEGTALLKELHPQLVAQNVNETEGEDILKDSVVIEDVYAWKAGLKLTSAARPVRPLVEFEETEPKL